MSQPSPNPSFSFFLFAFHSPVVEEFLPDHAERQVSSETLVLSAYEGELGVALHCSLARVGDETRTVKGGYAN